MQQNYTAKFKTRNHIITENLGVALCRVAFVVDSYMVF